MRAMNDFGKGVWLAGKKNHRCEACYAVIPAGERHFHFKGMYHGDWQNWRMHTECHDSHEADGCEEFMPGEFPVPDRIRSGT